MRESSNAHLRARKLRREMSRPERILWSALRGRDEGRPAFRRQHPTGPYVLDFYCARARLAVEVDGAWHGFGDKPERDARRDGYLAAQGILVVRISARGVLEDPTAVANGLMELAARRLREQR